MPSSEPIVISINSQELAMILAALRLVQDLRDEPDLGWVEYIHAMPHFESEKPLEEYEIDALCERVNVIRISESRNGISTGATPYGFGALDSKDSERETR